MNSGKTEIFSEMPVAKAVLTLAIPTVISQLITVIYNMADTFFIGQLNDPLQVAAATISMPIFVFLTAFANLFGIGGSSMIARSLGRGDKAAARHASSFSIWTGAMVSILYGIIMVLSEPIIFPRRAHNIILDPIFIFGFDMEIRGAAIATMLSNLIATCYFILFIRSISDNSSITFSPSAYSLGNGVPGEIIAVGLPGFMMTLMGTISNTVLNHIVAGYSNSAIAGMGIAKKIDSLAYAIGQGISQGLVPLIGYNYSSGNRKRMKDSIRISFTLSLAAAFISTTLLFAMAEPVSYFFIDDEETALYGMKFLRIIALACPSTMINFMIISLFQAMGRKAQPFVLSFLRKGSLDVLLMLPLSFFFGLDGIAWATPAADWTALIIAIALFIHFMKAEKEQ